jgi:hypothetical protein
VSMVLPGRWPPRWPDRIARCTELDYIAAMHFDTGTLVAEGGLRQAARSRSSTRLRASSSPPSRHFAYTRSSTLTVCPAALRDAGRRSR